MDNNRDNLFEGRYRLIELLGSGTSANVYRAFDEEEQTEVALKIFDEKRMKDEDAKHQFDHEIKALALLDTHPNIVSYYGGSMREGCRYIVMELAVGETLMHYMNLKGGKLSVDEALNYFSQILSALSHVHGKGVIHRDVKPQNVRLVSGGLVKLVDFGIAMIPGFENISADKAVGTVNYISPEQATGGRVDRRSDLYSAGILLYEMLTGHLPFQSEKSNAYDRMDEIIRKHLKETPARPGFFSPNIPTAVEQIVLRAINKNPAKRFDSAEEMLRYIKLYHEDPRIVFDFDLPNDPFDAYDALPDDTAATRFVPSSLKLVGKVKGKTVESAVQKDKRKKPHKPIGFLAGVFAVLLCVFLLVSLIAVNRLFFYETSEKTVVTVGDLCNTNYSDSLLKELEGKGYEVTVQYAYHPNIPINTIISQEPAAQSVQMLSVNEKPKLTLTVSGGCRIIVMPDCANTEYRKTKIGFEEQGFTVTVIKEYSSTVQSGNIIATYPKAGDTAIQNEPIQLIVSMGEEIVYKQVPSLIGLQAEDAISALDKAGVPLGGVHYEESDAPVGQVIAQSKPSGERIPIAYYTVEIVISKGRVLS